jgi:hypothetical protein
VTTSAARRRRSTWIALATTVGALVVAVALTVLGAATLANSKAGRNATDDSVPVLALPATPTALLGAIDGGGALTSVALLVIDPTGAGGSVVSIAPTADSTLNLGDDRLPLDETLATQGPDAFRLQAEALTSVSFDVAELADAGRLTALLEPLGPLAVELPDELTVERDGRRVVLEAGANELDAATAAAVLTTTVDEGPDHALDPARDAVWDAVAGAVGDGIGDAPDAAAAQSRPADLDAFVERLYAAPVGWRNLQYEVPPAERNPRGVDVVVPDRAEVLLVVGQIAPSRVAAPNPSLTFRVESSFPADVLDPLGVNNADVATDAISRLLFVQANVVSVDTSEGDPPAVTKAYVADGSVVDVVERSYPLVFGEVEVVPAEYRIAGVDVIVVLGDSYLDKLSEEPLVEGDLDGTAFEPDTAPDDPSADTTAVTTAGEDGTG